MNFFATILAKLLPVLLEWTYGKASSFFKRKQENEALKEKQDARDALAAEVEELRKKILALESAGQEVPREMKDALRDKARRLIHS